MWLPSRTITTRPQRARSARFCALIGLADQMAHAALADDGTPAARDAEWAALSEVLNLGPADWDDCMQTSARRPENIDAFVGAIH